MEPTRLAPIEGSDLEELRDAIVAAYPDGYRLATLLDFDLRVRLADVAAGDRHPDLVHSLLEWAQTEGREEELIAASKGRSGCERSCSR